MSTPKLIDHLRRVEIFNGLVDAELLKVAGLCQGLKVTAGKPVADSP